MAHIFKSTLQKYINAMSEELGFEVSQAQIARATGVRQATISDWSSGKPLKMVSAEVLFAIASYFEIENPWDLLVIVEDDDDPELDAPSTLSLICGQASVEVTYVLSL